MMSWRSTAASLRNPDTETAVLVVCHGGVIDAVADYILISVHTAGSYFWSTTPGSPNEHRGTGRELWRLHASNMAHHLIGEDGAWLGLEAITRAASPKADPTDSGV
jgi:hypothetical protein